MPASRSMPATRPISSVRPRSARPLRRAITTVPYPAHLSSGQEFRRCWLTRCAVASRWCLAEVLDRISRDQEDAAGVFKRRDFAGVKIITLSEGEIGHLHVGLKGTMNALFLKDLTDKTRRVLRGRVSEAGGGSLRRLRRGEAQRRILDCANGGNAPRTIAITKRAACPRFESTSVNAVREICGNRYCLVVLG
jgi:hypothetical protein